MRRTLRRAVSESPEPTHRPPARRMPRHSKASSGKTPELLFWTVLVLSPGRGTRAGQTSGLHIFGEVLESRNYELVWLRILRCVSREIIWLLGEKRG